MTEIFCLLKKDIYLLYRIRDRLLAVFLFAFLLVVVASFSFKQIGHSQAELRALTPGIIWLIFLFSGLVGLSYSFSVEQENSALQGLLLTTVDPLNVYLAKFIANSVFLTILQLMTLVTHIVLFGVDIFQYFFQLLVLIFLVACGFSTLGTLLSAVSSLSRAREILLPIILFPLCVPLILAALNISQAILAGRGLDISNFWFLLLLGFDVVFLTLSAVLFEFAVSE